MTLGRHLLWFLVAVLGAFALGTVALVRGEAVSALWIVVASVCVYLIAYRYYSLFNVRDIGQAGRYLAQSLRLMVGLPSYDAYLAHMSA